MRRCDAESHYPTAPRTGLTRTSSSYGPALRHPALYRGRLPCQEVAWITSKSTTSRSHEQAVTPSTSLTILPGVTPSGRTGEGVTPSPGNPARVPMRVSGGVSGTGVRACLGGPAFERRGSGLPDPGTPDRCPTIPAGRTGTIRAPGPGERLGRLQGSGTPSLLPDGRTRRGGDFLDGQPPGSRVRAGGGGDSGPLCLLPRQSRAPPTGGTSLSSTTAGRAACQRGYRRLRADEGLGALEHHHRRGHRWHRRLRAGPGDGHADAR